MRSPNESESVIRIDPNFRPCEKIGHYIKVPGVKKGYTSFDSTYMKSQNIKGEQTQILNELKHQSLTRKHKHKHRKYTPIVHKSQRNYNKNQNNSCCHINSKINSQSKVQRNGSNRGVPQHPKKIESLVTLNKNSTHHANNKFVKNKSNQKLHNCVNRSTHVYIAQESHRSYSNNFKQGSNLGANTPQKYIHKSSSILCNYCCNQVHVSVECWFRKNNNMSNVVWMSKSRNE